MSELQAWWRRQGGWKWIALIIVVVIVVASISKALKGPVNLHGAPNVQGLTLDVAEQQLRARGFGTDVHDNALFGVIVASHFTVCDEHPPIGHLVVLDVSKHC
jgi:hypothetical protein